MGLIERFEDIKGWQEARVLVREVYELSGDGDFGRDFGMRDQIRRAAVSVMTNIAEGFDCASKVEFARFLGYARRSVVEVQSLLYTACDVGYISPDQFTQVYEQAAKTKALVGGFIYSLKRSSVTPDTRKQNT
jgi:four helix bundle protein